MDETGAKFKRALSGGCGGGGLGKEHTIERLHNSYTINQAKTVVWSFYSECCVKSVMGSA